MSALTRRQQALAFVTAVDTQTFDALDDLLHEDFTHSFLPGSLHGLGKPPPARRSRAEFINHVRTVVSQTFERFNFQLQPPQDLIQGQADNGDSVVVLHLVSDGRTTSGHPYNNEWIFIFRFADGKILNIKEFLDSKYVSEALAREVEAAAS